MQGYMFTYNPRRNDHCRKLSDEDVTDMKEWLLGDDDFKRGKIGIVVERPGEVDAHMHVVFETRPEWNKARNKTQYMERYFETRKETLPERWRWGTQACHVKYMSGAQTIDKMFAGYLMKEEHEVKYQQGFDEEELDTASKAYARHKLGVKKENLVETTYMEKALAYRQDKDLETEDLAEVLAAMENDNYSIAYLLRKRKISQDEVWYFRKRCRGDMTGEDIRDLLYVEPPEKALPPLSTLLANKFKVSFDGPKNYNDGV